ncbi:AraC family transcriptional regulator [Lichenihabitans sp. Uapishka_5]|uniref:helix-turn-helix transcriptional regulator n=1 Tax=Lichenihabitans sp. Uapishka_5 TaxID=3037302 RepID=UPI0029E7EF69|nr:AraC family transcriptional regulator [Lichenihabitans sp. Uapishka_5]MDX7951664.1 AraC family transcriptional regulator [Lichenihabitans sp. Uapishka_5]
MEPLEALLARLDRPLFVEALFDAVPDTIFFVKDAEGRYVAANQTLAERTGFGHKQALIGRTADQVFPGALGRRIAEQDRTLLRDARSLKGELELHLYPDGREGWCLTWKEPLFDRDSTVAGLVGLSRDLRPANAAPDETAALSRALQAAQARPGAGLKVSDLAGLAGLSAFQLDQRLRTMFGLSAGQWLTRLRIDEAGRLLRQGEAPISAIALSCGYADQTSFTRQFRKLVGLSPGAYRKLSAVPPRP